MKLIGYKNQGMDFILYLKGTKKYYKCFIPDVGATRERILKYKYTSAKKFKVINKTEYDSRLSFYKDRLDREFKGEYAILVDTTPKLFTMFFIMVKKEISYAEICQELI
jgi:hypothetical protein